MPDITNDAYDLQRQIVRAEIGELSANRVLSGENGACQGFVNDRYVQRVSEVTLAEAAASQQRDPHRAEIAGSADANVRAVTLFISGHAEAA